MKITEAHFAGLCLIAQIKDGGKARLDLLEMGYNAYAELPPDKKALVKGHLNRWGYRLPKPISRLERSEV